MQAPYPPPLAQPHLPAQQTTAPLPTRPRAAATGISIIQQRARLGVIDGAEENVDLGALLSRLASMFARTKNTGVVSLVGAAQAAYQAAIPHFQRDGELPDVRVEPGGGWRWCAQGCGA